MIRATTRSDIERATSIARSAGRHIVLVPTMGYLHEGHLSLIDAANAAGDLSVVSVFVNPLQFGPGEDLDRYPRDLERDAVLAAGRGTDVFFAPDVDQIYAGGSPAVIVNAPELSDRLCGRFRPGHFSGVLTVVLKLFNIVRPHAAVFGRKDFQQLALIRRMVLDLDLPVRVLAADIVREPDGLALSSRNVFLDPEERRQATLLQQGLRAAQAGFSAGMTEPAALIGAVSAVLADASLVTPQYIELVDPETLGPVDSATPGHVLALAAHVGRTRLIDNQVLHDGRR